MIMLVKIKLYPKWQPTVIRHNITLLRAEEDSWIQFPSRKGHVMLVNGHWCADSTRNAEAFPAFSQLPKTPL